MTDDGYVTRQSEMDVYDEVGLRTAVLLTIQRLTREAANLYGPDGIGQVTFEPVAARPGDEHPELNRPGIRVHLPPLDPVVVASYQSAQYPSRSSAIDTAGRVARKLHADMTKVLGQ